MASAGYISQIQMPSGNIYDIKDARFDAWTSSNDALIFQGVLGTGASQIPNTDFKNQASYEPGWVWKVGVAGTYGNGLKCEVGDLVICVAAKGAAYADADFTVVQNNVDGPMYSGGNTLTSGKILGTDGTAGKVKVLTVKYNKADANTGSTTVSGTIGSTTYTPAGTVSKPSFTGTAATISMSYTPAGTVSQPSFTGTAATISMTYTPAGSLSKPTLATTSIKAVNSAGSAPSLGKTDKTVVTSFTNTPVYGSISDEILTLSYASPSTGTVTQITSWSAGSATTTTDVTVGTGVVSSAGSFTGTTATLSASYTPAGTVSKPTFSGTAATLSTSYTPAGSVSQPTFTGTTATHSHTFTGDGHTHSIGSTATNVSVS